MATDAKSGTPAKHREPWYAEGLRFECTQCGNCCTGPAGYVWFDDDEAQAIAKHLGLAPRRFYEQYGRVLNGKWSLTEYRTKYGYDCVFLKRDQAGKAMCGIYPVRPSQCRTWPFWPETLATQADWRRAGRRCPGLNSGTHYPLSQIRIIRDSTPDP